MTLERQGIICAGNWIVDLVHDVERWPAESTLTRIHGQSRGIGGGAANVISALARLEAGIPLWPMGAVGDDDYGGFIRSECQKLGLQTTALHEKPGIPTAHTHVMSVAGQSRTFFYQGGANDVLSAADFPPGTFADSAAKLFYLGYLTLLGELDSFDPAGKTGAAKVLERAQAAGLITCVDLVSTPHPEFSGIVASAAPHIDYLVVNEIEAAEATGIDSGAADGETLLAMARALLDMGVCRGVVIHCVERIVWLGPNGDRTVVEVTPVPASDIASNLGAGDAFCAGLLFGLHQDWSPRRAIDLATATARASLLGHTATEAIPPLSVLTRTL